MTARRFLSVLLIAVLVVGVGCGQAKTPPAPAAPADGKPAEGPVRGGRVVVALQQEPPNLNPYFINMSTGWTIINNVLQGLLGVDPEGNYYPVLAEAVPTVSNGGVSADGKQVTYKLKKGLLWSDGKPVTSKDVKFTFEVLVHDANPTFNRAEYDNIEKVETPDEQTAVVHFKEVYAPYLSLFQWILPAHANDGKADLKDAAFNSKPFGTGPFMIKESASGSHVTLVPNPNYAEKGKPYLDQLVFRYVPNFEAGVAQLRTGEVDVLASNPVTQYEDLKKIPGMRVGVTNGALNERIIVQMAKRGNPADSSKPHEILGDKRVRQALNIAIDRKTITERLLFGVSNPVGSVLSSGWAADPSQTAPDYDPDKAAKLLEDAGWKLGDGKVRMKEGKPLRVEFTINSGNKMREMTAQVIQEQLAKVGVEISIRSLSASVLWARWADGGVQAKGDFDLSLSADGPVGPDPHLFLFRFLASELPTPQGGYNAARYNNPEFDRLMAEAGKTADMEARKVLYNKATRLLYDDIPWIVLYQYSLVDVFRESIKGQVTNPWIGLGWDMQNWYIQK